MLEPDLEHLVELLQEAQTAGAESRRQRGRVGRRAAEQLSWDAVAGRYRDRIEALANTTPLIAAPSYEPFPFSEAYALRLLATPAWQGHDRLAELLDAWCTATTRESDACLYLLADPGLVAGPEQIERVVLDAADRAGADLDRCADIDVLMEPFQAERDRRLVASVEAYVPLHVGCSGYLRLAQGSGVTVVEPTSAAISAIVAAVKTGGEAPSAGLRR